MKSLATVFSRAVAGSFLLSCLMLVTGCAVPLTPMFQRLEADKTTTINLVVERAPFEYTAAVHPEAPFADGGVAAVIFGPVAVQLKLSTAIPALNQAARARNIATDHRQVFIAALVRQFAELGITANVIPLPYERRMMNGDRMYYRPIPDELLKLPSEPPSFYLQLDMGTCTATRITACIRYYVSPTSYVTSPGPSHKSAGLGALEPNLWDVAVMRSATRFNSIEDAVAQIDEFDAQIARLVPIAVARVVEQSKLRVAPPAK
jgi:hypothetical protein